MSKVIFARVLVLVALFTSGWFLLVGFVAPFSYSGLAAAILLAATGIASLAAAVVAAMKPRQLLILTIASLLTIGHAALWLWVARIALSERGIF